MHYTINKNRRNEQVRMKLGDADVQYVPGHSLGEGWTRHIVELAEGDTADNPGSTKHPVYGPCVMVYDVARSGITGTQYNDSAGFYKAIRDFDDERVIHKLKQAHEAAQGKGDQGAFDVWNVVGELLKEDKPDG